jgi:hypothetical protein
MQSARRRSTLSTGDVGRIRISFVSGVVACIIVFWLGGPIRGEDDIAPPEPTPIESQSSTAAARFTGGFALGFAMHESGHLTMGWTLGKKPRLKKIGFHGLPFFAIDYRRHLSPREHYVVASAGFWAQFLYSEWILTRHPDLRHEKAPCSKGVLAFHVLTSLGYSGLAFTRTGPIERDSLGMARGLSINERWIGAAILVPAGLDVYRYYHPKRRWAAWTSRGIKAGLILLCLK